MGELVGGICLLALAGVGSYFLLAICARAAEDLYDWWMGN
jgi:hypothetical protein